MVKGIILINMQYVKNFIKLVGHEWFQCYELLWESSWYIK